MTTSDSPTTVPVDRLRRWRAAIVVSFALGGVMLAAFGTRLPSIQASLGVSKTVIGTEHARQVRRLLPYL